MFAMVTLKKSNKKLRKSYKIEKKFIGDVEFIKMTLFKEISAKKIERKLKNRVDKVILSGNLKNLNFEKMKVSDSSDFQKRIITNTFFDILSLSGLSPNRLTVCVNDRDGKNIDFVKKLVDKAVIIKVITDNKEDYSLLSSEVFEEFGTELVFSDNQKNCKIGIDFDSEKPIIWFNNPGNAIEISKDCIKLSSGISAIVPKGIYECDFANELKENIEFKRLNLISASFYKKNGFLYKFNSANVRGLLKENSFDL